MEIAATAGEQLMFLGHGDVLLYQCGLMIAVVGFYSVKAQMLETDHNVLELARTTQAQLDRMGQNR